MGTALFCEGYRLSVNNRPKQPLMGFPHTGTFVRPKSVPLLPISELHTKTLTLALISLHEPHKAALE